MNNTPTNGITISDVISINDEQEPDHSKIQEDLLSELKKLELSTNEAEILLHLISHGNSTASDISRQTGIPRTETYHYISMLLSKGVVLTTFTKPQKYYALKFDEAIDYLVQTKYHTLKTILKNKREYQDKLEKIMTANAATLSEIEEEKSYQVLVGEDVIHAKVKQILTGVKTEILGVMSAKTLSDFYHAEITDSFIKLANSRGVKVNIHTSYKGDMDFFPMPSLSQSPAVAADASQTEKSALRQENGQREVGKEKQQKQQQPPELKHSGSIKIKITNDSVGTDFVIFDNKEMVILLDDKRQKRYGIYINNLSIISTFCYIIDKLT